MKGDATSRLIDGLSSDLRPVRRLPPLRWAFVGLLLLWGALAAAFASASGLREDVLAMARQDPLYASVLLGLGLAAAGSSAAALASGVPGRQATVRWAGAVGLAGLGLALGACVAALVDQRALPGLPAATERACFSRAAIVGLLPGAALVVFALRGWVERPVRAAAVALGGGSALAAALVHLSCRAPVDPTHLLLGHVAVPVAVGLLGALPVGAILRRWAR